MIEVFSLVDRVFTSKALEKNTCLNLLNYFEIPVRVFDAELVEGNVDWKKWGLHCVCLLSVVAAVIESDDRSEISATFNGIFQPAKLHGNRAAFNPNIEAPSASGACTSMADYLVSSLRDAAADLKKFFEPVPLIPVVAPVLVQARAATRANTVGDVVNEEEERKTSSTAMTPEFVARLIQDALKESGMPQVGQKHSREEVDIGDDDVNYDDIALPRKTARQESSESQDPVASLLKFRGEIIEGNRLKWRASHRPADTKNWYPSDVTDQLSFLGRMALRLYNENMEDLFRIFIHSIIELAEAKSPEKAARVGSFSEGLFITLSDRHAHHMTLYEIFRSTYDNIEGSDRQYQRHVEGADRQAPRNQKWTGTQNKNKSNAKPQVKQIENNAYSVELEHHLIDILRRALTKPTTSQRALQRSMRRALISHFNKSVDEADTPSASNGPALVRLYSHIFGCGDRQIDDSDLFPNASVFYEHHKTFCRSCSSKCSGHVAYKLLCNGWQPKFITEPNVWHPDVYNYEDCKLSITREIQALVVSGKISSIDANDVTCVVPIKIVLKSDHVVDASTKLGLSVSETDALGSDLINQRLEEHGFGRIKTRLVADFRSGLFNDTLEESPFCYSTIHDAVALAHHCQRPYFVKIDFSQYFHQIPLSTECRRFFGIAVKGDFYWYNALPFGIKQAPIIASLITAEVVRLAEALFDIRAVAYIDDVLIVADGEELALKQKHQFLNLMTDIRLIVNMEKVVGPVQDVEFLGMIISATKLPYTLSINLSKLRAAKDKVQVAINQPSMSFTKLASLAGTLLYLSEIVTLGWCHTLPLWSATKGLSALKRSSNIHLSETNVEMLCWWLEKLQCVEQGSTISVNTFPPPTVDDFNASVRVYTDASGLDGYGYHTQDRSIEESFIWPEELVEVSDMLIKELMPFRTFLVNHGSKFENRTILWFCDNGAACMTLNGGAANNTVPNSIIMDIILMSSQLNIFYLAIWIPRELNHHADYLSHLANMFSDN